jgi:hypothetical protein
MQRNYTIQGDHELSDCSPAQFVLHLHHTCIFLVLDCTIRQIVVKFDIQDHQEEKWNQTWKPMSM